MSRVAWWRAELDAPSMLTGGPCGGGPDTHGALVIWTSEPQTQLVVPRYCSLDPGVSVQASFELRGPTAKRELGGVLVLRD